jgi:hypothetical protein
MRASSILSVESLQIWQFILGMILIEPKKDVMIPVVTTYNCTTHWQEHVFHHVFPTGVMYYMVTWMYDMVFRIMHQYLTCGVKNRT